MGSIGKITDSFDPAKSKAILAYYVVDVGKHRQNYRFLTLQKARPFSSTT
jgi:hypothetical protein